MFFSIIIPAYNAEKYISETIDSVLKQSIQDYELIIVNDGSTDSTLDICRKYEEQDSNIKVISKENGGASSAKNAGLEIAKGDYLVFLDSDDYWEGDQVLESIKNHLIESKADCIYTTPIRHIEGTNEFIPQLLKCKRTQIVNHEKADALNTLLHSDGLHTGMPRYIPKREIVENNKIRFVEGEIAEDLYWCERIIVACKTFDVYTTPFYVYRKRKNSVSGSKSERLVRDYGKNIERCDELAESIKNEKYYSCIKSYISYQYSIMFYLASKQKNRKQFIDTLKRYKKVLKYSINKKAKMIRVIVNLLGIRMGLFVLSVISR